jgi:hypothetical protein
MQDARETFRQIPADRHLIRNFGSLDLGLGPYDALGQRGWRREERPGDLLRREAADFSQREGNLGIGWQGRVTAGEDQPETIVLHTLIVHLVCWCDRLSQLLGDRPQ